MVLRLNVIPKNKESKGRRCMGKSKNSQQQSVLSNLASVKEMIDATVTKMEAKTATSLEVGIISALADCRDCTSVMEFTDLLEQCEDAFGFCPFSGAEEWPPESDKQIALLTTISDSINIFVNNPPIRKVKESSNFCVVVKPITTEACSPFSELPPDLRAQLCIAYDDSELKIG